MNDQHPHAGYVGDDAHTTGSFAVDPLFGAYPAGQTDHSGQWDFGQYGMTGQYDTTAGQQQQYDTTGQWNTTGQWDTTGQWQATDQYGSAATHTAYDTTGQQYDTTGQWDASAWTDAQQTGQYETVHAGAYAAQGTYGYEAYDATGQWAAPAFATETGAYDATAWNQAAPEAEAVVPQQYTPQPEHTAEFAFDYAHEQAAAQTEYAYADELVDVLGDTAHGAAEQPAEEFVTGHTDEFVTAATDEFVVGPADEFVIEPEGGVADEPTAEPTADPYVELRTETPLAGRPVRRGAGSSRGRRRTPAKRSALLTVAVPSACVMGVAGIAAASVSGLTNPTDDVGKKDSTTTLAAADPGSVKQVAANSALDTQLAALSEDARDFGDRASRTQERIDLRVRQEAEKKKREEEAARKEALRPKFMLPVELHRLSARFGQSGVNWMSVHTGIDFPVQTGTPVMAATDGTVRTQINSAYGNMVIVTAPDGTETWYCHLSSAKIRYGSVKAGDVIAYSGDTGNSTGPHLHFEVRPGGGYAIDPLAWLRSHGLDPTS
ncbi:peptidoglycan DD-metalloendopeptidase family protein [Streptomyces narbonensis]|uniref:Peptidoglycan DD-metalloendopeptidase family protein n=1 Tax=Streptomyces narbonensis TaxID=67333 RepID=A0ABV3C8H4_9ACTN